jgi:uncharacterized SAM-binding protein YcdF (DUF218 family)
MLDIVLSPLTWLLLGTLGAIVFGRGAWRTAAITLVVVASVVITPLGANLLVHAVESQTPDAGECAGDAIDAVVVLGGGLDHKPRDSADISVLSGTSVRRLFAGVDLLLAHADAHLYLLGASDFAVPESVLSAHLAEHLSVPADAITTEKTSRTTWQNAQNLRQLLHGAPPRIWLVTSALHLPRAALAFRTAGFAVCPVASDSDYMPPGRFLEYYLPRTSALRKADAAIHELVGELVYRIRAWNAAAV